MKSIAYIPGSNGAGNASQMTVQTLRSPGASDILVNTVTGVPTKFYGSMGEPHTFTDPVTNETITIISEATAVDFAGHIDTGKIVIDAIAPGYVDTRGSLVGDIVVVRPNTEWANNLFNVINESHNDDGTIKAAAVIYEPTVANHVTSGGIWSALTGLNAAMTAITLYQGGYRGTVAAVASRTFTASKDTYVDVLRTLSGYTNTFTLVYTEVANGAAAPALAANSVRIAKVVTGASVTSVTQSGGDSLLNPIYPSKPTAPIIYSTTEQLTGDIWVDGRPIYRSVIRGQVTLVNGSANIAHGIPGLTTAWELLRAFVGTKYTATSNNGSQIILGAHREAAGNWNHVDSVDISNISWVGSFAWGSSYFTAVLEYVK